MQAPLSELEAVNDMLLVIQQAPINSFSANVHDANIARSELAKVAREISAHGFSFNTDKNYVLTPTQDGIILVPIGALRLDPTDPKQDLVARLNPEISAWCLWDKANLTWQMSEPVRCTIVWSLAFEALPETARSYAALAAGRRFQARTVGDPTSDRFNAEAEARAWATLIKDDAATADRNIFSASPELATKTNRRRRVWRAMV